VAREKAASQIAAWRRNNGSIIHGSGIKGGKHQQQCSAKNSIAAAAKAAKYGVIGMA